MPEEVTQFRMTVWPGPLPPVTQIEVRGPYRLEGELIRLHPGSSRIVDIPDEMYLRQLRDLNLDDPAQIQEFLDAYGRLGHWQKGVRVLGCDVARDEGLPWEEWHRQIDTWVQQEVVTDKEEQMMLRDEGLQHLEDFRAWVLTFRAMTDIWKQHKDTGADPGLLPLAVALEELLEPFSPKLGLPFTVDETTPAQPFGERVRLESALALQLFNHMAAGNVYNTCANETCLRLFVHQQGRAKAGQYRGEGVMYCTDNCARAQAARQFRRRQRQKKGETK